MAYAIGIDMGGTKIEGVLVRSSAPSRLPKVVAHKRLPTLPFSLSGTMGNIVAVIEYLSSCSPAKITGIGISSAGFLRNGRLEMVPNIPALKGIKLKEIVSQQLRKKGIRVPLIVENDAICFALAEFMFGAAKGSKNIIGLIVGTGIGGGLILDGRVYRGRDGGAGHIGHTVIDLSGPKCGCGQRGHFESWCSGKQITLRYLKAGGKIRNPGPAAIFRSKDSVARNVMAETYEKFGLGLANIINAFNPEIIVLGGGVSNLPPEFYRKISVAARKHAYPALAAKVKIIRNRLGDSAGVLGAACLTLGKQ